ncbi:MAG: hypothetical protein IKD04_06175 [Clostridia bacterium]|nr:hypothetical protein [Clostridia bacterium]
MVKLYCGVTMMKCGEMKKLHLCRIFAVISASNYSLPRTAAANPPFYSAKLQPNTPMV